jgi:hypothetical protein
MCNRFRTTSQTLLYWVVYHNILLDWKTNSRAIPVHHFVILWFILFQCDYGSKIQKFVSDAFISERVIIVYSNITSFFRFVDKRAIYRWYNLIRTWLFHWQHKLCATFSASVNINYRLPIKVYYRICTHIADILLIWRLRNKSWKPECVLNFNMDWRVLVFYPEPEARNKIY